MSQQHESIEPVELSSGPTRRTILKAAAWSAPVVAIATAAPLASASPTSSDINVTVGSNISGTGTPDGTASGNLAGALNITSIGGSPSWETGALTAVYSLDASNGAAWGGDAAIVDGSSAQFTAGGVYGIWTVTFAEAMYVAFEAPSQTVTSTPTSITLPAATYSGSYTNTNVLPPRRVSAVVSFSASGLPGGSVGSSSTYPG